MKRSLLALLVTLSAAPTAKAGIPAEQDGCLECHGDESMTFKLSGGETLSLYVDRCGRARWLMESRPDWMRSIGGVRGVRAAA